MKKFCLLLVGVIAFVLTSCEEKIPSKLSEIEECGYVFKKKDGKILTGVEAILPNGKKQLIIPIEYDRITTCFNDNFFLVYKGNEAKVRDEYGAFEFDGISIKPESIKFLGDDFHMAPFYGFRFEDMNGKKYWWFSFRYLFSGYDDLIPCKNGFIFKKGNKYGFAKFHASYSELKSSYKVTQKLEVTISEKYDALYEVTNNLMSPNYLFLAREENKWVVLNSQGQIAKRYPPCVNKSLASLPLKDKIELDLSFKTKGGKAREGQKNAGLISVSVYDFTWSSYFQ